MIRPVGLLARVGPLLLAMTAAAQTLPDGPGRELVQTICTECHDTARIVAQHRSKADWAAKVTEMLQEAPDVSEAERATIVQYLAAQFPAAAKINVNKASAKDLESVLQLAGKDAQAIVQYRAEKGDFKSLEDLKKVPGVDTARIEAVKARLDF